MSQTGWMYRDDDGVWVPEPPMKNLPDDAVRFSFPCKTVSEAQGRGNSRGAAIAKTKRVAVQRHQARMQAYAAAGRITGLPPCIVKLSRLAPSNGLDDDNLRSALKAVRDGIADALGVDDRDPRVSWEYDQRRGPYSVEVEIRRRG